jgi:RHS repeat-associated protein
VITALSLFTALTNWRRKTILSDNTGILKTKYFVGSYEEEITTAGTRKVHYIAGGDGLTAVYIEEPGDNPDEGDIYYTYTDHLGSIVALANNTPTGNIVQEQSFGPWGRRRNIVNWGYENAQQITLIDRGYTGHEHLGQFGIINMNGRMYDPVLGRMLSPDNYVQAPDFTQNFNRFSYCVNNPLKYTDPSGDFFWIPVIAGAVIYGVWNTAVHMERGDIHNFWDGLGYFAQGAVVGAVAGATWSLGIGGIAAGNTWAQIGGWTIMTAKGISAISTVASGIRDPENAVQILMGRAYTDENRGFFGAIGKGISRNTWESIQTWVGYNLAQIRNASGKVDEVEYFGGVTFAIDENVSDFNGWLGASYGNYILAKTPGELDRNHPGGWMFSEGGLFWHEYGHTTDSQIYGLSYLFTIGISSAGGADWTEIRANRWAANYAAKFGFMEKYNWLYPTRYPLDF